VVTTHLPRVEGKQTTRDHQGVLQESEMVIITGLILQVMPMLLQIKMKMAMDIASKFLVFFL
jgi:hypothetical protein